MFDRYTEKARRVIFFARYEASQFGSHCIESDHLLLGLLREDKEMFRHLLPAHVELQALTEQIRSQIKPSTPISTSVDLPLSKSMTRALAAGAEEAERLGHRHVGTAHLLLGLLTEDLFAVVLLNKYGIDSESLLHHIAQGSLSDTPTFVKTMNALAAMRSAFSTAAARLTHETEPATVFLLEIRQAPGE